MPFQNVEAQETLLKEVLQGENGARKTNAKGGKGGRGIEEAARELTESWRRGRVRALVGKGRMGVGFGV